MRYLGIDFGTKRVGIALSDPAGRFALPEAVLPNDWKLLEHIKKLCIEREVKAIVLGESRDFLGEKNKVQKKIELFKKELTGLTGLPVIFEPELLTSREASHIQGEGDMLDASAAALILKGYLDKQSQSAQ